MTEAKRVGRPPIVVGQRPKTMHVIVSPDTYDRLYAIARREDVSIPELVRRGLVRMLGEDDAPRD